MTWPVDQQDTKLPRRTADRVLAGWRIACIVTSGAARIAYRIMEGGTILAVFGVGLYVGYWLVFGAVSDPRYVRVARLLPLVSENWKAFLLLGVPLFYRTVRTFMEEVEEAAGMKRRALAAPIPAQVANPPEMRSP